MTGVGPGGPKGLREPEPIRSPDASHQQLRAAIVLIRDRLSLHRTPAIRSTIAARRRLRVYRPPACAPELNPAERVRSTRKGDLVSLAAHTAGEPAAAVGNPLTHMRYRILLIDGYLTGTGLPPPLPNRPWSHKVSGGRSSFCGRCRAAQRRQTDTTATAWSMLRRGSQRVV